MHVTACAIRRAEAVELPCARLFRSGASQQIHSAAWQSLRHAVREIFRYAAWEYVFCRVRESEIDLQGSLLRQRVTLSFREGRIRKNIAGREASIRVVRDADGRFAFELRRKIYLATPFVVALLRETEMLKRLGAEAP